MPASRLFLIVLAGLVLGSSTGCESLLHNLKPHRLWRLNRHSPPMSTGSSVYYSVPPPSLPVVDLDTEFPTGNSRIEAIVWGNRFDRDLD
jgi:hypothetical protein